MEDELETGVLYHDDSLRRLTALPTESVDLIYLDPPFFSNRHYEVIWGDEAEIRSFEDRWEGGIDAYIDWMRRRFAPLHRILKPTGTLYFHCDPNASHYLKVLADSFFGYSRFRSEIIWKRSSAHSDTKQGRSAPGSIHDTILMYSKGDRWTWNPIYLPYDEAYIESKYRHVEPETGRRYRLGDLTAAKPGGEQEFEWQGCRPYRGRYWAYSREKMDQMLAEGRIVFPKKPGGVPEYKRYLDEMPGVPLQDLWTDLDPINAKARERLGYPTQKPESLLERIIQSSTNEGDVVLDPFCGCGTTVAVAESLRRRWIGIDISPTAVELMNRRILKLTNGAVRPRVRNMPVTEVQLYGLKPFEFQNWVLQQVAAEHSPRRSGDMGIDGLTFFHREPIQVKRSYNVGRNVVDNFETAVERSGNTIGYIIAFTFTRGAYREAARARNEGRVQIRLIRVADLIKASEALVRGPGPGGFLPVLSALASEAEPEHLEAPDLLRLFGAATREPREWPLMRDRPQSAKPSVPRLRQSDQQPEPVG